MAESEDKTAKYSMFLPKSGRSILLDYPELGKALGESGRSLNKSELLFSWFYACKASPLFKVERFEDRVTGCLNASFKGKINKADRQRYISGDFPAKIEHAIDIISRFEPGPRIRGKLMIEKILTNFEKMVDEEINDSHFMDEEGKIDFSRKKAYIDAQKNIVATLPALITQAEGGFSVSKIDDQDEEMESFIDEWHKSK